MTAGKRAKNSQYSASPMQFGQRCAVRITYARDKIAGQWRAHGRYILREGAVREAFTSGETHVGDQTLGRWQAEGDERLWKFIVSPEFGDRVDLQFLVTKLMERMERDLGTKLERIAMDHYNTEHPHAHVALRGLRDDGTALDLHRDYIKSGIRQIAEDLCTRQLGYRTEQDKFQADRRELNQTRPTSLDRIIAKSGDGGSGEFFMCNPLVLHLKMNRSGTCRPGSHFFRRPAWQNRASQVVDREVRLTNRAEINATGSKPSTHAGSAPDVSVESRLAGGFDESQHC